MNSQAIILQTLFLIPMSRKQCLARNVSQKLNKLNLELIYDIELECESFEIFLPASCWRF